MKQKGISSLYKEALRVSHEDLERAAALDALRSYGDLSITLGELVDGLQKDWGPFSKLTLREVFEALRTKPGRPRRKGRRVVAARAAKRVKKAAPAGKKPPKRLTRAVSEQYTALILAYLKDHPGAKAADIARDVGLLTKQAAALLKKMRATKVVRTAGKRAGMVYHLSPAAPKKAAPRKAAPRKAAPKKAKAKKPAAPKKAKAKKPAAPKKPVPPKRRPKRKTAPKK